MSNFTQVTKAEGTYTVTQLAAGYGMSAKALNGLLNHLKIQRQENGQWILYKEHMNKGYTKQEVIRVSRSKVNGDKLQTVWTEAGRKFIDDKLREFYGEEHYNTWFKLDQVGKEKE